jgi:phage FluMu protein Com
MNIRCNHCDKLFEDMEEYYFHLGELDAQPK